MGETRGEKARRHVNQDARDKELDATYRLDGAALSVLRSEVDARMTTLGMVASAAPELAEDFAVFRYGGTGFVTPDVETDLIAWEEQRFGRKLEPAAHGIMLLEVRRAEGSNAAPAPAFASSREELAWRRAARTVADKYPGDTMRHCEAIVIIATGRPTEWVGGSMPKLERMVEFSAEQDRRLAFLRKQQQQLLAESEAQTGGMPESQYNARMAELRAQAEELVH